MPLRIPEVQLAAIAPELALCVAALVLIVVDAFIRERVNRVYLPIMSSIAIVVAAGLAVNKWSVVHSADPELQLSGMVALDGFSIFIKVVLAVFGLLTIWLGREYFGREHSDDSEFYALVLFSLAGMMLMASAADLIVMFLALETFSIALYVLVGFRWRSIESQEAALKYFLLGAFSSAFFLLGIALSYGAIGSTRMYAAVEGGGTEGIVQFLRSSSAGDHGLLVLGMGLLIIGLGFKIAAVPFHMWTPDAYQGAPSPVTGFMAAASKLAGFAALLRLLAVLFPLRWDWRPILIGVAIATMVVGAVLAVVQEDLKRILAYSSIAHAGYLLIGLIAGNDDGVSGTLFYLATYGLTVIGAFAIVAVLSGRNEAQGRLALHKGLFYEHPLLVGALTLFMLSLAGVPLTAGFVGKLVVFLAAVESGYWWLVIVGVVSSAIAAFFYLRVLVVMYMQEPEGEPPSFAYGPATRGVIGLAAAATIVLGLYWGPLIDLAERATFFFAGG